MYKPNLIMKKQSHKQEYPINQLALTLQDVSIMKGQKRLKNFQSIKNHDIKVMSGPWTGSSIRGKKNYHKEQY